MNNYSEVSLIIASFINRHTLKASRVRDLSAGNKQPLTVGCHPQPLTLVKWLSIFIPAGDETGLTVKHTCRAQHAVRTISAGSLRDDRRGCSGGLTLQFQRAVDYHCTVCCHVSSLDERRN